MFDKLIKYLVERAGQEYSAGYRAVATVLGATLFLAGWPALVWVFGLGIDEPLSPSLAAGILSALFFFFFIPW